MADLKKIGLYSVLSLSTFSLFSEYFLAISVLYITIVLVLIVYSVKNIMVQKALSNAIGVTLLMACYLIINDDILLSNEFSFYLSIVNDNLGYLTKFTVCFFSALVFFIISDSLQEQMLTSFEYLLILLLAVLGLMLLCSSNDLLTAYLAIELTSLSSYLLASFRNTSSYSVEAGVKYFITGAISSALFLLGSSLIYACSGSIFFSDFWDLFSYPGTYHFSWIDEKAHYVSVITEFHPRFATDKTFEDADPRLLAETLYYMVQEQTTDIPWYVAFVHDLLDKANMSDSYVPTVSLLSIDKDSFKLIEVGMVLILFSIFIKLSLAPFHLWSLDVYEGSPTTSTLFFAVMTKLSLFVFLIRFSYSALYSFNDERQFYFLSIAILSVFVGSFGGLKQRKLKTLLAYSSVSHMGYCLLALSGVTLFGIRILLFYLLVYMMSSISTWFTILLLRLKQSLSTSKYSKELGDIALLGKSNAALALGLSITMFSIAGLPPLIGFVSKIGVFLVLLKEKFYFICSLAILCSVVSTFYYIRIVKVLYFENLLVGKLYYPIKTNKTIILSAVIFFLLFLFVNPSFLFLILYNIVFDSLY